VTAALSAAQLAVSALNTSLLTEEWRFVSYRLLWVLPWSASNRHRMYQLMRLQPLHSAQCAMSLFSTARH
jgi:hypothetical protein